MTYEEFVEVAEYYRFKNKLSVVAMARAVDMHWITYTQAFKNRIKKVRLESIQKIALYLIEHDTPVDSIEYDGMIVLFPQKKE